MGIFNFGRYKELIISNICVYNKFIGNSFSFGFILEIRGLSLIGKVWFSGMVGKMFV